jgi:hypothetical protein
MARTVVALYDDFADASDAVRELTDEGFSRENISMMAADPHGEYAGYLGEDEYVDKSTVADGTTEGAGVGAGIGAVVGGLGGLLIGLGALVIPGIGPVLAAGPLAAALTGLAGAGVGAVAGGVTGGLLGALVNMGIPEESAHYYAEGVRRGGTLVTVRTSDELTDQAVDTLNDHNPVDINSRVTKWREEGWKTYNPEAGPYFSEDVERPESRDIDIDRSEDYTTTTYNTFDSYDPMFRRHYDTALVNSGYSYDQYLPAYRYGYDLATNDRFASYETWSDVEPEARRYWEEENPGTWEQFKVAIQDAWEEVKDILD